MTKAFAAKMEWVGEYIILSVSARFVIPEIHTIAGSQDVLFVGVHFDNELNHQKDEGPNRIVML